MEHSSSVRHGITISAAAVVCALMTCVVAKLPSKRGATVFIG